MLAVLETALWHRAEAEFADATRFHGIEWLLIEPMDEAQALRFHREKGAGSFVLSAGRYSPEFYEALRPGTLVQRFGVGYDAVPVEICRQRGIVVGYTPGVLDASVAEHALALTLALSRQVCRNAQNVRGGGWQAEPGVEMAGRTLALIGFGRIARRFAALARHGLGMRISAFARDPRPDGETRALCHEYHADLPRHLAGADVVSLHLPATPETADFVGPAFLAAMKPGSFLINTARGSLIQEEALHHALLTGPLAGAALDVTAREPYEPQGPDLRTLPNCIITPHCASNTREANRRMALGCIANLRAHAAGDSANFAAIPPLAR